MGIIKEPINVDFEVENRPLTKEEEKLISEFIKNEKEKILLKKIIYQNQKEESLKLRSETRKGSSANNN